MKCHILLSLPPDGGENYFSAFCGFGFAADGKYLADDPGYDGLVLCGGGDIDPAYFGQPNLGSNPPDARRDVAEFSLLEKYAAQKKPVFGICRGMQIINVFFGGGLIQHLDTAQSHSAGGKDICHGVENIFGSPAYRLFGPAMTVNSAHHQGCDPDALGNGISVMQRHADGTAEGIFGSGTIGVQWHPERMTSAFLRDEKDKNKYTDPAPLFGYFMKMIENNCKFYKKY